MQHRSSMPMSKSPRKFFLGLFAVLCLLAVSACGGSSNTAQVYDNARVLNTSQVRNAASKLPDNVDVYTVNNFTGTQLDFQRAVTARLGNDPNKIVMGIDTLHHYVYVAKGANVPLTNTAISQSVNSFASNYGNGDYTKATVAALGTMNQNLQTSSSSGGGFSGSIPCFFRASTGTM